MEWGTDFQWGLCVGFVMAAVFVIWCHEEWRRAYNKLLGKYYKQRRKLKELDGSSDIQIKA